MASTTSPCKSSVAERSYAARKAHERKVRIARARINLKAQRVSLAPAVERKKPEHVRTALTFSLTLAAACHVGVAYAAFSSGGTAPKPTRATRVEVRVIESPPPKVEEPVAREPEPVATPKVTEATKPVAPEPRPVRKAQAPQKAPPPANEPEFVPIVGLTLESTSASSQGPAFAVGHTLAGTTGRVAAGPTQAPSAPIAKVEPAPTSRNRRVAPRAAEGVQVEPARRLARVEPKYPPLLERQGVEADVTVRVYISAQGTLERVELVRGAPEAAFNEAALEAAQKERFAPESHDGKPVATALTYTYRFRIAP